MNLKILLRENIQLVIEEGENYISERIELNDEGKWIPIVGSNAGLGTLNFWSKDITFQNRSHFGRGRGRKYITN